MKILWHMPTLRRRNCGLSRRAARLARELVAQGHPVRFLVRDDRTDVEGSLEGHAVDTVSVSAQSSLHWSFQARARSKMAKLMLECVDDAHDLFFSSQPEAISAYKRRWPEAPAVFVCGGTTLLHDAADRRKWDSRQPVRKMAFRLDSALKHRNERDGFRAADLVVFDSEQTRSMVVAAYRLNPENCHAIYGGIDASEFHPPTAEERADARASIGVAPEEHVIAWTGRLSPEKNVGLLIEACAAAKHRRIRLFVVGEGEDRGGLHRLALARGIGDRVRFTGPQDDVRPFLRAADLFVFPSIGESFGGSLVEAMATGLACIALSPNHGTVCNASREILADGLCGRLVDDETTASMAQAIDQLLADAGLRRLLGDAAARRARDRFTWAAGGRQLNELIERWAPPESCDDRVMPHGAFAARMGAAGA